MGDSSPGAASFGDHARKVWERWKAIAHVIGDFQSKLLLNVFYFVILGPVAVVRRMCFDRLHLRPGSLSGWIEVSGTKPRSVDDARRQF